MLSSFFIAFREGLEAFLVIGIIISYLTKIGEKKYVKHVIYGAVLAVVLSIGLAYIFQVLLGGFEGKVEEVFEGIVMMLAVVVLTYMIFWMNKQAKSIRGNIEASVGKAIDKGRIFSLFFLGFIVVFREGAETVLFFRAISYQVNSFELILGGTAGILSSIILAIIFFLSTRKVNLGAFFKITGILVMLIATGLFSTAIHEFQEAGIMPVIKDNIYDIGNVLSKESIFGGILRSLFGYNPSPSLLETAGYVIYILVVSLLIKKFYFSNPKEVVEKN
ncbi:MAG: FTR1 family protein [Actinomycetia bacterium]|nr:FTR1 family protein [Actinomycetes bacterium]